jgi:hypothetical protein
LVLLESRVVAYVAVVAEGVLSAVVLALAPVAAVQAEGFDSVVGLDPYLHYLTINTYRGKE